MKTVLVAVLDWGLGHATRSIPIIQELQRQGAQVLIAGNGRSLELLRQEFPSQKYFELPSYDIRYPENGSMIWAMARQLPRVRRAIRAEQKIVNDIVEKEKVNAIISDNRYGCYNSSIPSIFLSHQLNLQMPDGWKWLSRFVNVRHQRLLKRFSEVWIPDMPGDLSLSGALSKTKLPNTKRLGILSRFNQNSITPSEAFEIVALISGPEPQRTIFENIIRQQLLEIDKPALLVKGIPGSEVKLKTKLLTELNHLKASELEGTLALAKCVISRSGYSTIMDLSALGKRVILVPTPGQTEQEYLAKFISERGWAVARAQRNFNLTEALGALHSIHSMPYTKPNAFLPQTITDLLCGC